MKQTAVEWLVDEMIQRKFFEKETELSYTTLEHLTNQAKEMEKEQMCSFVEFVATYPDKNKNINGEMLHAKSKYDDTERTIDLLETFKTK